ncbi:MAG: hypothetical protein ACD_33C00041G0007 [uncultured bacterium]|nr:MAG: hypothetical protein ACD_33C00041G0007 [uncultured bacterium]
MKKFIFLLSILMFSSNNFAVNVNTYIPPQAFKYKEIIQLDIELYFKNIPEPNYIPSLIEHESCISLTHKRCWNPSSQLKTSRELGIGVGQLTKAYNKDGSIRFDALKEIRDKHKADLKELSWENIAVRPDLQIRAMTLMLRDLNKQLYNVPDIMNRLHMVDASYNGGLGGLLKERRACALAANCDPNIWFKNIENYCLKSKKVLYGNRSACDINRHHTYIIFKSILPKYKKQYF